MRKSHWFFSGKYLPLSGEDRKIFFTNLIGKIQSKLQGWKTKILSQASKTVLIRAVASSIPFYVMSSMMLPKFMAKKIGSLFRRFWWGYEDFQKKKFTPKSWHSICLPKSIGGLGLKQSYLFNTALVSKLAWSFLNGHINLWKEAISKKYLSNNSFFDVQPKPTDSLFWKNLLKQRDFIRQSIYYQINNGASTRVWIDP